MLRAMQRLARLVIGVVGALAVIVGLRIWMAPAIAAANLGLAPVGALGVASLRADVAGFFAAAGILSLAGAIRNDRRLLTAPVLLIGLALTGRLVSLILGRPTPPQIPPMAIEAVLLVVLASGRQFLGGA
jgi:hypothetical protein